MNSSLANRSCLDCIYGMGEKGTNIGSTWCHFMDELEAPPKWYTHDEIGEPKITNHRISRDKFYANCEAFKPELREKVRRDRDE